jgi:hypothetical protein
MVDVRAAAPPLTTRSAGARNTILSSCLFEHSDCATPRDTFSKPRKPHLVLLTGSGYMSLNDSLRLLASVA